MKREGTDLRNKTIIETKKLFQERENTMRNLKLDKNKNKKNERKNNCCCKKAF